MTRRNRAFASDPAHNAQFRRLWSEPAEHVGGLADRVVEKTGRDAVMHWLRQSESLSGADRTAALECADDIRAALGLSWSELLDRRIAA